MTVHPSVCRYEHFLTEWYSKWTTRIGWPVEVEAGSTVSHRKLWEFAAILETLDQNGLLSPGKSGVGFAVGREPLPGVMAAHGVDVLATDLMPERVPGTWIETNQHAWGIEAVYDPLLLDRETFDRHVKFEHADMRDLSGLTGEFDFLWSSCAFEHIGTLEDGFDFVVDAMRLLKPGGIAVHTTEYNVSSNEDTVVDGGNCIYRRRDIEALDGRLRHISCGLEPVDFDAGTHHYDLAYDREPFFETGHAHVKLELAGFVCTSVLLVARKA